MLNEDFIIVNKSTLRFISHPPYNLAHPDEEYIEEEICTKCVIAERLDTKEKVLLWLVGGIDWVVSRVDPNYHKHKDEL